MPSEPTANGLTVVASKYLVKEALGRLEQVVKAKGLTLYARFDHSAEAAKVLLEMRPSQVLAFGNPRSSSHLIASVPTVAIDLPMRVLAWQDDSGKTWVAYDTPEYLKERHGVPESLAQNVSGVAVLVEQALR